MGGDAQADLVAEAQGQHDVIKVQQVGLVLVDEVLGAIEEFLAVGRIGTAAALCQFPVPDELLARRVVLGVKILRIEAFPPLALAVGLGEPPS